MEPACVVNINFEHVEQRAKLPGSPQPMNHGQVLTRFLVNLFDVSGNVDAEIGKSFAFVRCSAATVLTVHTVTPVNESCLKRDVVNLLRRGLGQSGNGREILRIRRQTSDPGREVRSFRAGTVSRHVDPTLIVRERTEDRTGLREASVSRRHNRHRETPTHFRRALGRRREHAARQVREAGGEPTARLLIHRCPVAVKPDEVVRLAVERDGHLGYPFGLKGGVTRTTS